MRSIAQVHRRKTTLRQHTRHLRLAACITLVLFSLSLLFPAQGHAFFFGGVTLKDEQEMGRKFDMAIRSGLPMVADPEVSIYVRDLVNRIVRSIPPQPFRFKPGVILHPSMNAFAVPGGYIYVFTGLLMNFNAEEEVAGVVCHELAHVTQRHVASRLERAQMISIGSLLLAVAGVAVGGGSVAAVGALGAGQSAMLDYSRADETEADQIGMQYLIKAGYPPIGMVNGFKVLRQKSRMMGASIPAYLSTHPDIGDRINGISARILKMPKALTDKKVDNRRFKRMQVLLWGRYGTPETALQRFRGQDALSLMGRGMVHSRLNNVSAAASAFDAAVARAPQDSLVLREAGIFNYRKGSMAKARTLLQKALQLDARDYMASFFYARLLDDDGLHREAQRRFRDVLHFVPDDAEVHESLARSYGADNRQDLAYVHLTYSAIYSHNKKQAERYFNRAKSLGSSTPEFRRMEKVYKERKEIWEKM